MKTIIERQFDTHHSFVQDIEIPKYSELLHVDKSPSGVGGAIWFETVTEDKETKKFELVVVETGEEIPLGFDWYGTFLYGINNDYVKHIYLNIL